MRTIPFLATAALASAFLHGGAAVADDRLHLTPPLYREQARATQQVRSASDLTTLPRIVPAAPPSAVGTVASGSKVVVEAAAR